MIEGLELSPDPLQQDEPVEGDTRTPSDSDTPVLSPSVFRKTSPERPERNEEMTEDEEDLGLGTPGRIEWSNHEERREFRKTPHPTTKT